ncbi:MAG: tail fiber protein [Ardenticatenaceae bacterium]|nr:tail fiber protein [Ardenticatenaceae bacterium]
MDLTNVGQISAFIKPPKGWLIMAGQSYKIASYPELAATLPDSWKTSELFFLPNMAGRTLVGNGELDSREFTLGLQGGEHSHTLTGGEMPIHNHLIQGRNGSVSGSNLVSGNSFANLPAGINYYHQGAGNTDFHESTILSEGLDEPHENMPPYLAVRWCIYAGR